jgi:hypothetical protein
MTLNNLTFRKTQKIVDKTCYKPKEHRFNYLKDYYLGNFKFENK